LGGGIETPARQHYEAMTPGVAGTVEDWVGHGVLQSHVDFGFSRST
jgi:hypothetical protein